MTNHIVDPEVQALAMLAATLRPDYEGDDDPRWATSPFGRILQRPSRQAGKIGEQLVSGWCAMKELSVGPSEARSSFLASGRLEYSSSSKSAIRIMTIWFALALSRSTRGVGSFRNESRGSARRCNTADGPEQTRTG